ncbi:MAG: hypothetical protein WKF58_18465 [Ilumatobacteraceae bacterium]
MVQLPAPRSRWWSIPLAAVGLLALTGVAVAGFVPASTFAEKPLPVNFGGDGVTPEATPFARVPGGGRGRERPGVVRRRPTGLRNPL